MFILNPTFVFTVIWPLIGVIIKFSNSFGLRSLTVVVHVSTSKPPVKDVILIESAGYKVGGDMKLFIWNDTICPEVITDENIDDAWTVKATKFPVQVGLLKEFISPVQLIDPVWIGSIDWEMSFAHTLLSEGKVTLIEDEEFSWFNKVKLKIAGLVWFT